jgi:arylsulfatase A-like enzyme
MKADAWEAGHRMPFLVRWPGVVEAGSVTHHLVCFTDLLATFAELVNGKLPDKGDLDSESFLPVLTDSSAKHPPRGPLVMRAGSGAMMIRDQEWKLIDQLGSGGFSNPKRVKPGPDDPRGQLYNLSADPFEQSNLWKSHPELVRKLTARMKRIVK